MANLKELKTQIENANALGIANLTEKGVEISENATTFDIMAAIAEISGSGGDVIIGANYESIIYNEDDTITLTDKNGVEYTMSCTYEDDKLIGVTYDGKAVKLTYDSDVLVKVGKTDVNLSNAPKTPATTIKADSCVAQVIPPVVLDTVTAEINSGTVQADSSATLEE